MNDGTELIGQIIDGFKILEVAGRGGMGVVYKAVNLGLARTVAIKMIDPVHAGDAEFRRRFAAEAQALARTDTSNIVRVYDLREHADRLFIVMEFVQGETLAKRLEEQGGRMEPVEALAVARQTLAALSHAHAAGVIHRDIKPQNIMMLGGGLVKVTDFGLAKLEKADPNETVTQAGWLGGTLPYVAPEQVRGKADYRSDVYAVGMMMYQTLTGHRPFMDRGSQYNILAAIVSDLPPPIRSFTPDLPHDVIRVVGRALEKRKEDRYQSAAEMLADVEEALRKLEVEVEPASTAEPPRRSPRRYPAARRSWRAALAVGLAAIAVALAWHFWPRPRSAVLTVHTRPDSCEVFVAGRRIGVSPIYGLTLDETVRPGARLRIRASKSEHVSVDTSIVVPMADTVRVDLLLAKRHRSALVDSVETDRDTTETTFIPPGTTVPPPQPGNLVLTSHPNGVIRVGNREARDVLEIRLPANTSHRIVFSRGRIHRDTTVYITPGARDTLACYFQHFVRLNTVDENDEYTYATAFETLSGVELGNTSLQWQADAGDYSFTVQKFGYQLVGGPWNLTIRPSFQPRAYRHTFRLKKTQ